MRNTKISAHFVNVSVIISTYLLPVSEVLQGPNRSMQSLWLGGTTLGHDLKKRVDYLIL
jgi:hypothetical protein